jgi:hypothetical protein
MKLTPVQIEALPLQCRKEVEQFLNEIPVTPAARLRPRLGIDGGMWVAVLGSSSLQEGKCGFGLTPINALRAFNRDFGRRCQLPWGPAAPERNLELEQIRALLTETDELFASALGRAAIKVERQRRHI